jgi:hypothetical protein
MSVHEGREPEYTRKESQEYQDELKLLIDQLMEYYEGHAGKAIDQAMFELFDRPKLATYVMRSNGEVRLKFRGVIWAMLEAKQRALRPAAGPKPGPKKGRHAAGEDARLRVAPPVFNFEVPTLEELYNVWTFRRLTVWLNENGEKLKKLNALYVIIELAVKQIGVPSDQDQPLSAYISEVKWKNMVKKAGFAD